MHLAASGADAARIGILVSAGLAGGAAGTLFVTRWGDSTLGRRRSLLLASALTFLGGLPFAAGAPYGALLLSAAIGMVNGMGRDRGAAFTVEQAALAGLVPFHTRAKIFAGYNVALEIGYAAGTLAALAPAVLKERLGVALLTAYETSWLLYSALAVLSLLLYTRVSGSIEAGGAGVETPGRVVSPKSRRLVAKLSAISALDSLGGGFVADSLLAYWFFRRFGLSETFLVPIFLAGRIANLLSYPAAAWLSRRFGLVRTMVFTHLPAQLLLLAIPWIPAWPLAALLYAARELLVEMDVPARQAYITSIVAPEERTFASGTVNLVRTSAWTAGPWIAGQAMAGLALSAPLFVGGGLKIVYDLLLYREFRAVAPPEEGATLPVRRW